MSKEIKISKENRAELIELIRNYFEKERDEELGDLAASIFLDFIAKDLAPYFYNQGVIDSYKYMNDRIEDMMGLQK